jgi:hypothetical protein
MQLHRIREIDLCEVSFSEEQLDNFVTALKDSTIGMQLHVTCDRCNT